MISISHLGIECTLDRLKVTLRGKRKRSFAEKSIFLRGLRALGGEFSKYTQRNDFSASENELYGGKSPHSVTCRLERWERCLLTQRLQKPISVGIGISRV
jgi:hypothetical protein